MEHLHGKDILLTWLSVILVAGVLVRSSQAAFTCASGYASCPDDNVQVSDFGVEWGCCLNVRVLLVLMSALIAVMFMAYVSRRHGLVPHVLISAVIDEHGHESRIILCYDFEW